MGSIPGSGRSPGGGHDNPFQYSYLENPINRVSWWAPVHSVTQSTTRLKRLSTHREEVPITLLQPIFKSRRSHAGHQFQWQHRDNQYRCHIMCSIMLLLSRFSRVRLCETPQTAAHQAAPSLGFSRQEHQSGLCMKVKSESEVAQCVQICIYLCQCACIHEIS